MKKVINRKVYDTERAELLHSSQYSNPSDFNYVVEGLYRTSKGSFFLYGEGGPSSHYSRRVDQNSWSGGDGFTVLTEDQAIKWLEHHGGDQIILHYFPGKVEEA